MAIIIMAADVIECVYLFCRLGLVCFGLGWPRQVDRQTRANIDRYWGPPIRLDLPLCVCVYSLASRHNGLEVAIFHHFRRARGRRHYIATTGLTWPVGCCSCGCCLERRPALACVCRPICGPTTSAGDGYLIGAPLLASTGLPWPLLAPPGHSLNAIIGYLSASQPESQPQLNRHSIEQKDRPFWLKLRRKKRRREN